MTKHREILSLILASLAVFAFAGFSVIAVAPDHSEAVFYGGANGVYVPPIGLCPQHIWVTDFGTGASRALTNSGGTIYDYYNVYVPGRFVLGAHSPVPNPPCLIQEFPPIFLPYPLYNIIMEGTS